MEENEHMEGLGVQYSKQSLFSLRGSSKLNAVNNSDIMDSPPKWLQGQTEDGTFSSFAQYKLVHDFSSGSSAQEVCDIFSADWLVATLN